MKQSFQFTTNGPSRRLGNWLMCLYLLLLTFNSNYLSAKVFVQAVNTVQMNHKQYETTKEVFLFRKKKRNLLISPSPTLRNNTET